MLSPESGALNNASMKNRVNYMSGGLQEANTLGSSGPLF